MPQQRLKAGARNERAQWRAIYAVWSNIGLSNHLAVWPPVTQPGQPLAPELSSPCPGPKNSEHQMQRFLDACGRADPLVSVPVGRRSALAVPRHIAPHSSAEQWAQARREDNIESGERRIRDS
eukprot:scaffold4174_cov122-Isochrysis_galbana.AAC.15